VAQERLEHGSLLGRELPECGAGTVEDLAASVAVGHGGACDGAADQDLRGDVAPVEIGGQLVAAAGTHGDARLEAETAAREDQ
jgi:hypothetical protein